MPLNVLRPRSKNSTRKVTAVHTHDVKIDDVKWRLHLFRI